MTFSTRLQACQKATDMTVSDMARWFDRPRATVNTWLGGRTPFGPPLKYATKWLERLEWSVRVRHQHYPIPEKLNWAERERYVRGMRDDAERNAGVPNLRATG